MIGLGSWLGSTWFRMVPETWESQLIIVIGLGSWLGSTWFRMVPETCGSQLSILLLKALVMMPQETATFHQNVTAFLPGLSHGTKAETKNTNDHTQ